MSHSAYDMTGLTAKIAAADRSDPEKSYLGADAAMRELTKRLLCALFPRHFGTGGASRESSLQAAFDAAVTALTPFSDDEKQACKRAENLFSRLPQILETLWTDLDAAYRGDPAASGTDEIILCYPGFFAIFCYRIAHRLYRMQVPVLPRMLTEYAHSKTGIDIHPGARIGSHFFIDHGTGVVIGETARIGHHVRLYQAVTIGAKYFEKQADGILVKGGKRHPDIGSNVVIYAGATVLGGDTAVGDGCVIGGGVWLTRSVAAGETVTLRAVRGPAGPTADPAPDRNTFLVDNPLRIS